MLKYSLNSFSWLTYDCRISFFCFFSPAFCPSCPFGSCNCISSAAVESWQLWLETMSCAVPAWSCVHALNCISGFNYYMSFGEWPAVRHLWDSIVGSSDEISACSWYILALWFLWSSPSVGLLSRDLTVLVILWLIVLKLMVCSSLSSVTSACDLGLVWVWFPCGGCLFPQPHRWLLDTIQLKPVWHNFKWDWKGRMAIHTEKLLYRLAFAAYLCRGSKETLNNVVVAGKTVLISFGKRGIVNGCKDLTLAGELQTVFWLLRAAQSPKAGERVLPPAVSR